MNIQRGNWIALRGSDGDTVPLFRKTFVCEKPVRKAELEITAAGVYEAELNGTRVGRFILAPGWTEYEKRIQVQTYDITELLLEQNTLEVVVGRGWFRRSLPEWTAAGGQRENMRAAMIACLKIEYADGMNCLIFTDETWEAAPSGILVSGIFEGETVDARIVPEHFEPAELFEYPKNQLVPQQGCEVREQETVYPRESFRTPKGEWVLDFGQNLTGYMAFDIEAHARERLCFSTAEVLDREGNFYNGNYRKARSRMEYICREGTQSYRPKLTFFGFRYLRVDEAPEGFTANQVRAIVLHSEMKRTGWLSSRDPLLDQLFRNILWGQKGNYLEVPTDCPQRDERMGWTGDAQVFMKTATYTYDVRQFFRKWLADLALAQEPDGWIPEVIPNAVAHKHKLGSAGWSDAVTICPWQLYWTYGEEEFLANQFESMKAWVDYVTSVTTTPNLWTGGNHYGDWLGLDSPPGSFKGATEDDLVASAFYARSTELLVKAGKVLGQDMEAYERQYQNIVAAFRQRYGDHLDTQTAKVLAIHFRLGENLQALGDALARQITDCGTRLQTGFIGTAYVMHALSETGHTDIAWSLLLRKEYPSWLYEVTKGATTVWEHWDSIREDGTFWSDEMNSFNHYAYGAVADWVYEVACGIQPKKPGFAEALIAPHPDARVGSLSGRIDTVHGEISCAWRYTEGRVRVEVTTCVPTEVRIGEKQWQVGPGSYVF